MNCPGPETIAQLEAGCLDETTETVALRDHVASCAECRVRREELVAAAKLLATVGAPELAPRAGTWDAIVERTSRPEDGPVAVAIACAFCKGRLPRAESVYCAACLAPHHGDCWSELGRCASCANATSVRPVAAPPPRRSRARFAIAALAGLAAGGGLVAALRPREQVSYPSYPAPQPGVDVRILFDRAKDQVALGNLEGAAASLESYLAVRPDDVDARVLLGDVRARSERWDLAAKALREACERGASPKTRISLARALLELEDAEGALHELATAAKSAQPSAERLILVARAQLALGDASKARDAVNEALRLDPGSWTAHVVAGRVALARGELELAQNELGPRQDGGPEAWLAMGELLERRLDDRAVDTYYRAANAPPRIAARALARVGRLRLLDLDAPAADRKLGAEKARAALDRALVADSGSVEALVARARLSIEMEMPSQAQRDLTDARALLQRARSKSRASALAEVEALLGLALLRDGHAPQARERFEAASALAPRSPLSLAGVARARAGDPDAAERFATARAAAAEPDREDEASRWYLDGVALAKKARASRSPADYLRARAALGRATALDPLHALAHLARAKLATEWKAWALARSEARAASAADPTLVEALVLAAQLDVVEHPRDVIAQLEPLAPKAGPHAVTAYLALAEARRRAGDPAEALADLDRARSLLPARPDLILSDPDRTDAYTDAMELFRQRGALLGAGGFQDLANENAAAAAALANAAAADASASCDRGWSQIHRGDFHNAVTCFDRALELQPTLVAARAGRLRCRLALAGAAFPLNGDVMADAVVSPEELDAKLADLHRLAATDSTARALRDVELVLADAPESAELRFARALCLESRAAAGADADLELAAKDLARIDHDPDLAINTALPRTVQGLVAARRALAASSPAQRARLLEEARKCSSMAKRSFGLATILDAAVASVESFDDPARARSALETLELLGGRPGIDISPRDPLFEGLRARAAAASDTAPVASPAIVVAERTYTGEWRKYEQGRITLMLPDRTAITFPVDPSILEDPQSQVHAMILSRRMMERITLVVDARGNVVDVKDAAASTAELRKVTLKSGKVIYGTVERDYSNGSLTISVWVDGKPTKTSESISMNDVASIEVAPGDDSPAAAPPPAPAREHRVAGKWADYDEGSGLISLQDNTKYQLALEERKAGGALLARVLSRKPGDAVTLVIVKGKVVDLVIGDR